MWVGMEAGHKQRKGNRMRYTHILITNAMGFANTRRVYPVPAALVGQAEERAADLCRSGANTYSRVVPLSNASAQDRRLAGLVWRDVHTTEALSDMMLL